METVNEAVENTFDCLAVSNVQVFPFKEGENIGRTKALAEVVLNDQLVIRGLRVIDGVVRAYKAKDLPEGYDACIDDHDNDSPHSMTVPWSGLRRVDLDFGYVNPDWMVRLNYTEPEKENDNG